MNDPKPHENPRTIVENPRQMQRDEHYKHGSVAAIALGLIAIVSVIAIAISQSGSDGVIDDESGIVDPPPPPAVLPEKELVEDLRVLWSFMRNFAHHYKRLPSSIEEMGAGFEIGTDGYVLRQSIWDARWEAGSSGTPSAYRIQLPGSREKTKAGAYRFRIIPVMDDGGNDSPLTRVLAVFPQAPSGSDVCFVALCGPVDLHNDFSFAKAWPVWELRAECDVVQLLQDLPTTTADGTATKLSSDGDFGHLVKTSFVALEWPKNADDPDIP